MNSNFVLKLIIVKQIFNRREHGRKPDLAVNTVLSCQFKTVSCLLLWFYLDDDCDNDGCSTMSEVSDQVCRLMSGDKKTPCRLCLRCQPRIIDASHNRLRVIIHTLFSFWVILCIYFYCNTSLFSRIVLLRNYATLLMYINAIIFRVWSSNNKFHWTFICTYF